MDSEALENLESKAEFRKPSNESANRKYRCRSSAGGSSSSSDGSQHEHSSSPFRSKKDISKVPNDKLRSDDGRYRDYDRNQSGCSGDLQKYSGRQSSRSYHKHDDDNRHDKHLDGYCRGYSKTSYRSLRDSKDNHNSHHSRNDREHYESRDSLNDVGKHSREKFDGSGHRCREKHSSQKSGSGRRYDKTEDRGKGRGMSWDREIRDSEDSKKYSQMCSGDNRKNLSPVNEELKGQRKYSSLERESSEHAAKDHIKKLRGEGKTEEKKKVDFQSDYKDQRFVKPQEQSVSDCSKAFSSENQESVAKKPKLSNISCSISGAEGTLENHYVTDSDIDAAKSAAMKVAELVNRNLVGTGFMSADQKKKLLWGNKKNTNTQEPTHHWDTANLGDRERQEKFHKLMGVKGNAKVENQSDDSNAEKQMEQLQLDLEKQYTAGLRRRDGRTVGLGL